MAYVKTNWKDRVVERPNTYTMTDNGNGTVTLTPVPGQIIERGTPLNAENLNKIEDAIVETNTQLSQKTSYSYVDKKIKNIVSGSPRGVYPSLSELKAAIPNGEEGIYITRDNNNWNYWNGMNWVSGGVYQSYLLSPNSINDEHISVDSNVVIKSSKNKIDTSKCTNGFYVDFTTGNLKQLADYSVSDYIYLNENEVELTLSIHTENSKKPLEQLAFYDVNKKFISGLSASGSDTSLTFAKPAGVCFVRLTLRDAYLNSYQLEVGNRMSNYAPYHSVIEAKALPLESIKTYIIGNKNNVIHVNQKGTMDFDNLRKALESITDSSYNNIYDVYIHEGEYNIMSYYTESEINSTTFKGLVKPPFVNLIGVGNVVLKGELEASYPNDTKSRVATLVTYGTGKLENLTITSKNLRYSVHDDYNYSDLDREVINCRFIKYNGYGHVQAYGGGVFSGHCVYFENCYFESEMGIAFSYHNNVDFTKPSRIKMVGCECVTTKSGQPAMRFGSMGSGQDDVVELIGCTTNELQIKEEQNNGVGIDFVFKGYGNDTFDISASGTTDKVITNINGFIKTK